MEKGLSKLVRAASYLALITTIYENKDWLDGDKSVEKLYKLAKVMSSKRVSPEERTLNVCNWVKYEISPEAAVGVFHKFNDAEFAVKWKDAITDSKTQDNFHSLSKSMELPDDDAF